MRTASGIEVPDGTPGAEPEVKEKFHPAYEFPTTDGRIAVLPGVAIEKFSQNALNEIATAVAMRLHALIASSKVPKKRKEN
jgi:hypothetical protein